MTYKTDKERRGKRLKSLERQLSFTQQLFFWFLFGFTTCYVLPEKIMQLLP